jgi:hypothetical protein
VGIVSDIGAVKITRTIFGRTRIRVVRKQDRNRRAWLLTIMLATATAAAGWQGWIIFQKEEYVAPPVPLSERIEVSAPVFRPAHISRDLNSSGRKSESLIQTEIDGLLSGPLPRHPPGWTPPEKPVAAEPSMANQATAPTTVQTPAQAPAQTAAQAQTRHQISLQPAATAVPNANSLVRRDASIPLPAGRVPNPVSAQD